MTNEEIRARMWEAYKSALSWGITKQVDRELYRPYFNAWLKEEFPELLEEDNPYKYIPVSEAIKSNEELCEEYPIQDDIWPSRRWKETPGGMTYVDLSGY